MSPLKFDILCYNESYNDIVSSVRIVLQIFLRKLY